MMRFSIALVSAAIVALSTPASAGSRVNWGAVQQWEGNYSFTRTDDSTAGTNVYRSVESAHGHAVFSLASSWNESTGPAYEWVGTAQVSASMNASETSNSRCDNWSESPSGSTSSARASITIEARTYAWDAAGFKTTAHYQRPQGCGTSPTVTVIGPISDASDVALPSVPVLCGTLDLTGDDGSHLTGEWAFYPKGHEQRAMPAWCPHIVRNPAGN